MDISQMAVRIKQLRGTQQVLDIGIKLQINRKDQLLIYKISQMTCQSLLWVSMYHKLHNAVPEWVMVTWVRKVVGRLVKRAVLLHLLQQLKVLDMVRLLPAQLEARTRPVENHGVSQ